MSQRIPLVLPTGSTIGRDGQVANARLINAYAESVGKDGKAPYAVYGAPGLRRWDTGSASGASRGLIELDTNQLIAVLGNEVYSLDQGGEATNRGNLVGSGRVMTSRNRAAAPQIAMLTSAGQVFALQSGSLTQVSDTDLPSPESVDYLGGLTIYGIRDGRIFASDLENSTAIAADAFGHARAESSPLVRAFVNAGFIYAMKEKGTEIWQPDPSLAGASFPFSPVQQNIDIGLGAKFSPAALQRGIVWVDDERLVRFGRDGGAQRISTHSVERDLEDLTATQLGEVYGFVHTHQGHEVYVLTSPLWTWVFDSLTEQWYERNSYGGLAWRANSHCAFNKQHIVGNSSDGALYVIDSNAYSDADAHQIMQVWCAQSHRFPDAMQVDRLELDVISGVGVTPNATGIHFQDGSHVTFGDVLDLTGSFTLEAIFNAENVTTAGQRILAKDNASAGWAISLGDGAAGSLRFFHRSMNTIITDSPSDAIAAGVNYHVGVVFDAAADTLTMYIDGVQVAQTTGQSNAIAGNSNPLTIGAAPDDPAGDKNFAGFVRDVRLWNVARSAAEIDANKRATLTGSETGLFGYWKLDEQTGATVADSDDTSEFPGTLVGNAMWSDYYWQHNANPQIMVDYSDDGGHTFEGERTEPIGRIGQYRQKVQFNRWGKVDEKGRIWRIRASASVLRGVIDATLFGEPLNI